MRHPILIIILSLITSLSCYANDLVIYTTDKQQSAVSLSDEPRLTIENNALVVKGKTTELSFPLQNVAKYVFLDASGVESIEASKPQFTFEDNRIVFGDCERPRRVTIYTVKGIIVAQTTIPAGRGGYFDTSSLQAGIYLVSVDGLTVKIAKK